MAETDTFTLHDGSEFAVLERPQGPEDAVVMQFRLKSGAGSPPPHVHPHATETYEVAEGTIEILLDDEWMTVGSGESVTVEPGRRHTFRNESGAEAVVRNVHDPHCDFESYIRAVAQLSRELETNNPRSLGAAARMAVLWDRHSDLIQPADPALKLAFPVLRTAARLLRLSVPG